MSFVNSESRRKAFLGKHAQDLVIKTSDQIKIVYQERGLVIPIVVSSTLLLIARNQGASLADISKALELPHQLVAQRVEKLLKLELIEKRADPDDKRRSEFRVTKSGTAQAKILEECMADTAQIYGDLYEEIGCDLPKVLLATLEALDRKSLQTRFAEKFKPKETNR
jgi:DNA-binding MarR family transcriptional regulator